MAHALAPDYDHQFLLPPALEDWVPEPRWMGPSFKSYPRNHWWGYVHNSDSSLEDIGFRVLLEPREVPKINEATKESQPSHSTTNRTSSATGSRR
jgi:hypothetical protein